MSEIEPTHMKTRRLPLWVCVVAYDLLVTSCIGGRCKCILDSVTYVALVLETEQLLET